MLKEDLLLDSASPISEDYSNKTLVHPENSSSGDPFSYPIPNSSNEREVYKWYVLRVSYSRELKVSKQLTEMGVRTFVPMRWVEHESKGRKTRELVPAVSNLCFVYWSFNAIMDFLNFHIDNQSVHFYWDRTSSEYMVVPNDAMESFIKVASAIDTDILYLNEVSQKFHQGQQVTVISGPFAGVTGKVVRVKKSRRILVEIPGILAVATAYIEPQCLSLGDVKKN